MADFEEKSEAFLAWFKHQQGATFHPKIQLVDLRHKHEGRGIIATSDIAAETELFSIPRKNVICVENSELSKRLPNILTTVDCGLGGVKETDGKDEEEDMEMPDPWYDLILVMIYEYLRGHSSIWKPYFDVLPDQFDTLMFWTPEELDELQASGVRAHIGKDTADAMFQTKVLPVVRKNREVFYLAGAAQLSDEELVALAHRMGSIIMAYAFDLDKEDDDEDEDEDGEDGWVQDRDATKALGMVPMADMLNADAEFNAHLNHEEGKLTMTSLRLIKAGEEILNYYGPLPRCDLLRRYGYTSNKHARYDVVELPWDLIKSTIDAHFGGERRDHLADDELEQFFVLERETGEPDDTGALTSPAKLTMFPEGLEEQVNHFIAPSLCATPGAKPDKATRREMKAAFAEIMHGVLTARLQTYATTMAEDEELLAQGNLPHRLRMAVDVRLGEKLVLHEALAHTEGLLEKNKGKEQADGDAPAAKRQKMSK